MCVQCKGNITCHILPEIENDLALGCVNHFTGLEDFMLRDALALLGDEDLLWVVDDSYRMRAADEIFIVNITMVNVAKITEIRGLRR